MELRFAVQDNSPLERTGAPFFVYPSHWVQILCAKCLHFHFEFVEGQNTKIPSKYQNAFEAQNAKISAVSAPILTGKAAFFSIFRDLSEKSAENASKA